MKYDEYLKQAEKRREKAFNLWHKGLNYRQIGERLGVSRQRAFAMVKRQDRG